MSVWIYILLVIVVFAPLIYFGNKRKKKSVSIPYVEYNADVSIISTDELFRLIVKHRKSLGKTTVIINDKLNGIAFNHCNFMVLNGSPTHENISMRSDKIQSLGFKSIGEIVGYGYSTPKALFKGYLKSPTHRAVIETDGYTVVGISSVLNTNKEMYNCVIFSKK